MNWYARDNYVLSSKGNTTTVICQANTHANAVLIAAAPDLLIVLKQIARIGGVTQDGFNGYKALFDADDLANEILDTIEIAEKGH